MIGDVITTTLQLLEITMRVSAVAAFFYWMGVFVYVHQKLVRASKPSSVVGYIESGFYYFPTSLLMSFFVGVSFLTELGKDV